MNGWMDGGMDGWMERRAVCDGQRGGDTNGEGGLGLGWGFGCVVDMSPICTHLLAVVCFSVDIREAWGAGMVW